MRTSPHIGPRRGFHLLCEYFESRFWLHLHCVFYFGESVLYLDYCNPRYSRSRKPLRLSVSSTSLYLFPMRRAINDFVEQTIWICCGVVGGCKFSPLPRLDSETAKAMGLSFALLLLPIPLPPGSDISTKIWDLKSNGILFLWESPVLKTPSSSRAYTIVELLSYLVGYIITWAAKIYRMRNRPLVNYYESCHVPMP